MTDDLYDQTSLIEHLLGRTIIDGDSAAADAFLAQHRVLVTGAGGSIGSALADALAQIHPVELVLLDHHENSLFQLRQRLMFETPRDAPMRFVLADIRNRRKMAAVLRDYRPDIIFHLAAYKHVPLAEESPEEFVSINVVGTWHMLRAACQAGVKKIVYPSTDKAVRPPSIYGATKRTVEMMVQAFAAESDVQLTAVRLVNVLGAHGGVIEIFARQIGAGQVPTVTDPAMTRYWITMKEALYLLTQAAHGGANGGILILDLGDPVKVVEIARRLWQTMGPAGQEFTARYVGIRPGERMSEYLLGDGEHAVETRVASILEVREKAGRCDLARLGRLVADLEGLIDAEASAELRDRLFSFVRTREA